MGEVYRADDLELNQSVALKFLPERLSRSASDLARLRGEVRTARQIAHPNVCRTYDIAESEGQVFVVMEYVDGEDLASVLRRLGRPSPDKALEIARQLCLGLGAAHENGVLHRDLKPANVMIDGRGRVRITDFGLAGTAEEIAAEGGVAGTPAYMAPEQRRAGGGSVQSDIFSLGLVLYEIFTGKKVSDMTPRPDPSRRGGADSAVVTPSSIVADIDPAVERVILRCLEHDPARRPQSAYAVYGALPGGDPLAAAVAAGETPSPELVANAGVEGSVRPLHAGIAVAIVLSGIIGVSAFQRPQYDGLERPAQVLAVRAEEVLTRVTGEPAPRFTAQGFAYAPPADSTRPKPKLYWRRWSPLVMSSVDVHNLGVDLDEPPQAYPGSGTVILSPTGRLYALSIVPDLKAGTARPATADSARAAPDWSIALGAAGVDPALARATAVPDSFLATADSTAAWRISRPGDPETTFVAASLRGRIIAANTFAGNRPVGNLAMRATEPDPEGVLNWIAIILFALVPIVGGLILTRRNLRAGRGDVRGAFTIGITVVVLYMLEYLFSVRAGELGLYRIITGLTWQSPIGHALIHGATMAIAYLAIEPYVRRLWPSVLVSWARIVSGRLRDPIVGRDILIGGIAGIAMVLLRLFHVWAKRASGADLTPYQIGAAHLSRTIAPQMILASAAYGIAVSILFVTLIFTVLVVTRFILRNNRLAIAALVLIITAMDVDYSAKSLWLSALENLVAYSFLIFVLIRFGFVAAIATVLVSFSLHNFIWTTDLNVWFGPQIFLSWGILLALLIYGFLTAVGGKSLFSDPLSDPVFGGRRPGA
jgi:hypothetical protein